MAISLVPIITAAGLAAVFNATNDGLQARITEVVFGDEGWVPAQDATALRSEQFRVNVQAGTRINPTQIHITAIENGEESYWVREIGILLSDGTLFAVWSDPQQPLAWKTSDVDLLLAFDMVLSALPEDSVIVEGEGGLNLSPATAEEVGLVRLATNEEAVAGFMSGAVTMSPLDVRRHGDIRYAQVEHGHAWNEINGRPTHFTPTAHTHHWGHVTGKPTSFNPSQHFHRWEDISDRPSSLPPSAHNHDTRYTPTNDFIVSWGRTTTQNRRSAVNWNGSNNFNYNFADIGPPVGYTMRNLMAFHAGIGYIHFSGNVNEDDRFWCRWRTSDTGIRVICNANENQVASQINYMGIWRR